MDAEGCRGGGQSIAPPTAARWSFATIPDHPAHDRREPARGRVSTLATTPDARRRQLQGRGLGVLRTHPRPARGLATVPPGKRCVDRTQGRSRNPRSPASRPAVAMATGDTRCSPRQIAAHRLRSRRLARPRQSASAATVGPVAGRSASARVASACPDHWEASSAAWLAQARALGLDGLDLELIAHRCLNARLVEEIARAGILRLFVWTKSTAPAGASGSLRAGVDGITTNHPDTMLTMRSRVCVMLADPVPHSKKK